MHITTVHPQDNLVRLSYRITAVAGTDETLPPLVSPGALIQQYFIDWENAENSQTLTRIQGPRDQTSLFKPQFDERFVVSPNTFNLTIRSVRFEDRGSYVGVVGIKVPSPGGRILVYEPTREKNITLEVIGE